MVIPETEFYRRNDAGFVTACCSAL